MEDCFFQNAKKATGESIGEASCMVPGICAVPMWCLESHAAGHWTETGSLPSPADLRDPASSPPPHPHRHPTSHPAPPGPPAGQAWRLFVWDPIVIWAPVGRSQLSRLHSARLK